MTVSVAKDDRTGLDGNANHNHPCNGRVIDIIYIYISEALWESHGTSTISAADLWVSTVPMGQYRRPMRSAQGTHGRPGANPLEARGRPIGDPWVITVTTWEAHRLTLGHLYMPMADPKATHWRSMGQ